jgi:hypothetical protein
LRPFCIAVGEGGAGAGDDRTQNLQKAMVFQRFGGCGVFLLVALCGRITKPAGMQNSGYRYLTGGSSEFHAVPTVRKSSKTHQKTVKSGKVSRGRVPGGIVDPPPLPPSSPVWSTIPSPSPLPLSKSPDLGVFQAPRQLQLQLPASWLQPALAPASCSSQLAGFSQLQLTVQKAPQRSKDAAPQSPSPNVPPPPKVLAVFIGPVRSQQYVRRYSNYGDSRTDGGTIRWQDVRHRSAARMPQPKVST